LETGGQRDIQVILGQDVAELFQDNDTDLATLLARDGAHIASVAATDPAGTAFGDKDVALVVLAVAALSSTLTPAIIRVVNRLTHRPVVVKEVVLVPVEDSAGRVVVGPAGEPMLHWMERSRALAMTYGRTNERANATIKALGVEITLGTSVDE
jgi:NADPH-dependent ferric siderophore reductase